mmetsp:Transcript_18618/g.33825  ORF Transcript_18618/g.33825 Transcript_18618/m.33825 type:complete len:283 (-) Transcript_18618:1202-2050(-)
MQLNLASLAYDRIKDKRHTKLLHTAYLRRPLDSMTTAIVQTMAIYITKITLENLFEMSIVSKERLIMPVSKFAARKTQSCAVLKERRRVDLSGMNIPPSPKNSRSTINSKLYDACAATHKMYGILHDLLEIGSILLSATSAASHKVVVKIRNGLMRLNGEDEEKKNDCIRPSGLLFTLHLISSFFFPPVSFSQFPFSSAFSSSSFVPPQTKQLPRVLPHKCNATYPKLEIIPSLFRLNKLASVPKYKCGLRGDEGAGGKSLDPISDLSPCTQGPNLRYVRAI